MSNKHSNISTRLAEIRRLVSLCSEGTEPVDYQSYAVVREMLVRCLADDDLSREIKRHAEDWPKSTRGIVVEAVRVELARRSGDTRSFLELALADRSAAPPVSIRPLEAWTVLDLWLREGGNNKGVALPKWVVEYFAGVASGVQRARASHNEPRQKLASAYGALGFESVTESRNVFVRDWEYIRAVIGGLIDSDGIAKGLNYETRADQVADLLGVEQRQAKRLIKDGRKLLAMQQRS